MDQLTVEELDEVQRFFAGTGQKILAALRAAYIAEWLTSTHTIDRERCWQMTQSVDRLEGLLRDAKAMNDLSRRARERLYEHRTKGV
jgi:hypothetical protein